MMMSIWHVLPKFPRMSQDIFHFEYFVRDTISICEYRLYNALFLAPYHEVRHNFSPCHTQFFFFSQEVVYFIAKNSTFHHFNIFRIQFMSIFFTSGLCFIAWWCHPQFHIMSHPMKFSLEGNCKFSLKSAQFVLFGIFVRFYHFHVNHKVNLNFSWWCQAKEIFTENCLYLLEMLSFHWPLVTS